MWEVLQENSVYGGQYKVLDGGNMCTGQKRGIRTGYCSPLFNWFTYFNSQGRCLDSEWPNDQTFSFSLALVRATKKDLLSAELIGEKEGRRPKSRTWDVQIFSESKEELFKSPRRWIRLNHSATFKYFFQRFKGFVIKFAPHVAEEFRAPAKFSIRTPPVADGTLLRQETL